MYIYAYQSLSSILQRFGLFAEGFSTNNFSVITTFKYSMSYEVEIFSFQNSQGQTDLSFIVGKEEVVLRYSEPQKDPELEREMSFWKLPIVLEANK